jgi:hypothetical protein
MRISNSAFQTYMVNSLKESKVTDTSEKSKKEEKKATTSDTVRVDKVEISSEGRNRLDLIKARIQSGFYQSKEVTDDISDKLGNAFSNLEPSHS